MSRRVEFTLSILMALAFAAPVLSQASPPRSSVLPVRVQVILTKGDGDKVPYTILTTSAGDTASLRVGSEVPIASAANVQGGMMFQQIGTQIDCTVRPVDDPAAEARYKVAITITKRDVYDQTPEFPQKVSSMPAFYSFIFAGTLILGNGGTAQISGTDMFTNEIWRADVTLSVKN